jgi:SNF2 family DNA or RNA helicase
MKRLMKIQVEDAAKMSSGGDLPNYSLAGTGKTLSTLEAFRLSGHKRGLVIAPNIALTMWKEEIEEWLGAKAQILRKGADIIDKGVDFVIAPYDLAAASQFSSLYKEFNEGALILDEADRLRGHTSRRSQAVFGRHHDGHGGFSEKFDQVWSLSGNPIYRFHDDLWAQLVALYPDVFAKYHSVEYNDFVTNFCVSKIKKYHPKMQPTLAIIASKDEAIIRHILDKEIGVIRRLEAPDLPGLTTTELYPKLGIIPAAYGHRVNNMTEQQLLKALVGTMEGEEDEDFNMAAIWQAVALAKVKSGAEHIADCAHSAPVLVGVWHNSVGQAYYEELTKQGLKARRVYGKTPAGEREEIRDLFNAGEIDAIIGQMQAMGVSWNLQKSSNRIVIAQDHFSPSIIEQFYKRVYRTGQTEKTHLDFLTSQHPLDVAIAKIRKSRARSQQKSLG